MTGFFEKILRGIFEFVGNYGWAVIIFTIGIKAVLLPLDIKSRRSMRAMSALSPKMEALKKRYANDQEKLNQKIGELYRKNKVNPLSGCLPMLLQLPILLIMFAAMRNIGADLQLDQMSVWVKDNFVKNDVWETVVSTDEWHDTRTRILKGEELSEEQRKTVNSFMRTFDVYNTKEGWKDVRTSILNGDKLSEEQIKKVDSFMLKALDANSELVDAEKWKDIRTHIHDGEKLTEEQVATVDAFVKSVEGDADEVIARLVKGEGAEVFTEDNGWLWVKNIFQPDSFTKTTVLTKSELDTMLGQYADKIDIGSDMIALLRLYSDYRDPIEKKSPADRVDAAVRECVDYYTFPVFFNMITLDIPTKNWSFVNGWFILPLLAGLTQFLQTKLTPTTESTNNQSGSGKFMKWFFPIFSVMICLSSTAAFAAYWVFMNLWGIVTNFIINKFLDMKNPPVSETEKEAIQP